MADTGNPWFIPFAEPSDLVRDWPALSSAVGTAVATGLSAASNAGIGSNSVQTVMSGTFTTTSNDYVNVDGLTVTITPTSDTAKVLILYSVSLSQTEATDGVQMILTDGSDVVLVQGDTAGNRARTTYGIRNMAANGLVVTAAGAYLWSPSSAVAVTAKIRIRRVSGGTAVVNRSGSDGDFASQSRMVSTLTAIEVKP